MTNTELEKAASLAETTSAIANIPPELAAAVRELPIVSDTRVKVGAEKAVIPKARHGKPVPAEGTDGLFTQSWFPICLAADIPEGTVKGYDFLDGRVVVWRGEDGLARVTSAYCPHMGASLEAGKVVGDRVQCAFHLWEYDQSGKCKKTGIGDTPPPTACLFVFPTIEKWGIIWAFNGETPLYDLPDFNRPNDKILIKAIELPDWMPVDPWVQCANTPDIQHIISLHRVAFEGKPPEERIEWGDYDMQYDFEGRYDTGTYVSWRVGVFGTSLYYQSSDLAGRWFGFLVPMGLPRPGFAKNFMVVAVDKTDDPAADRDFLELALLTEMGIVGEDTHIMTTMKFRPGTLTKSDKALGKYFDFLRAYPRAHPSAPFIR